MNIKIYFTYLLLIAVGISQSFSQDIYEPNDTYETATEVNCGQQLSAYIQVEDDVDWYEIVMAEPGVLEVAVTSVPDNINMNVEVHMLVENVLTLVADDRINNPGLGESMLAVAVVDAGTYFIKVVDRYDDAFSDSDPYEMELTCTPNALELNQVYEEAAPIALDTCFEANIYGDNHLYTEPQDVDWYEVYTENPGVLEVAVTSVPDNINMNIEVYQVIENVLTLISDDRVYNPGQGESMLSVAVVNTGTYLISVNDRYNDMFNEDTYSFCTTFTPNALELNQVYEEAAPIALDTCFEANIYGDNHLYTEPQDVDWYEVYTENPGVLEVAVTSVPDNINMNIEVYQVIENVLTLISDDRVYNPGQGESMLSVAVVNTGTYLISVNDRYNDMFNEDTYSFCTTFTPNALELNQVYEEAAPIALDTCFEANIYGDNHLYTEPQDVDWYEVYTENPGVLEVAVTSVPDNINMNIEVYQVIENVLTLISDDRVYNPGQGESMLSVAVVNTGTYLISVNDRYNDMFNEDTYSFCTTFTPNALELNQVYEEAAPIALDTCFEANIYGDNHLYTEPQDVDWYELIVPNDNYNLEIAVTSVPDNINMNVEVYQLVDNELTLVADDGVFNPALGESMFVSAVVNAGSYLISVYDRFNDAFSEDQYLFCLGFVGVDEEALADKFEAYPNPNNGRFNLRLLDDDIQIIEAGLYDPLGRLNLQLDEAMISKNQISLDTKHSPKGIYLLKIVTNKGSVTKKIIVR